MTASQLYAKAVEGKTVSYAYAGMDAPGTSLIMSCLAASDNGVDAIKPRALWAIESNRACQMELRRGVCVYPACFRSVFATILISEILSPVSLVAVRRVDSWPWPWGSITPLAAPFGPSVLRPIYLYPTLSCVCVSNHLFLELAPCISTPLCQWARECLSQVP